MKPAPTPWLLSAPSNAMVQVSLSVWLTGLFLGMVQSATKLATTYDGCSQYEVDIKLAEFYDPLRNSTDDIFIPDDFSQGKG